MKKTIGIGVFLLLLYLFGALSGIQMVNEELGRATVVPLTVEENEEQAEERVLELIEKKEKLAEIGSFNFFSDLGDFIADLAYEASRAVLVKIMSFVHDIINGEPSD